MGQVNGEARNEMEDVMASWKERGRGGASTNLDGTPTATGTSGDGDGLLPLGPGEWSEPLGLPLCVVCQNVSCLLLFRRIPYLYSWGLTYAAVAKNGVSRKEQELERT